MVDAGFGRSATTRSGRTSRPRHLRAGHARHADLAHGHVRSSASSPRTSASSSARSPGYYRGGTDDGPDAVHRHHHHHAGDRHRRGDRQAVGRHQPDLFGDRPRAHPVDPLARLVRGDFLTLREREFVDAARVAGASNGRIIFKHILPNAIGVIIVNTTLLMSVRDPAGDGAVSYLGFGIKAPDISLGSADSASTRQAFSTRPWLFWWPGMFIVIIALAINFIGDGLRDAFDPRQKRIPSERKMAKAPRGGRLGERGPLDRAPPRRRLVAYGPCRQPRVRARRWPARPPPRQPRTTSAAIVATCHWRSGRMSSRGAPSCSASRRSPAARPAAGRSPIAAATSSAVPGSRGVLSGRPRRRRSVDGACGRVPLDRGAAQAVTSRRWCAGPGTHCTVSPLVGGHGTWVLRSGLRTSTPPSLTTTPDARTAPRRAARRAPAERQRRGTPRRGRPARPRPTTATTRDDRRGDGQRTAVPRRELQSGTHMPCSRAAGGDHPDRHARVRRKDPSDGRSTPRTPRRAADARTPVLQVRDLGVDFYVDGSGTRRRPASATRCLPARCSRSSASPAPARRSPRWPSGAAAAERPARGQRQDRGPRADRDARARSCGASAARRSR